MKEKKLHIILISLLTIATIIIVSINVYESFIKIDINYKNSEIDINSNPVEVPENSETSKEEEKLETEEEPNDNKVEENNKEEEEDKKDSNKTNDKEKEEPKKQTNDTAGSEKREETTKKEEENPKSLVSTELTNEEEITTKYGVKITTTITYEIKKYSDGTIEKIEKNKKTTYDTSTFKATSAELKSEATNIASKNKRVYQEIVSYVNTYRSEVNLGEIVLDDTLSILATIRALEMAWGNTFSHTRPDGSNCFTIYADLNYATTAYGENIAMGYSSVASVSKAWYDSTGHRENMQNSMFNKIGVGMVEFDGAKYWVQLFAA